MFFVIFQASLKISDTPCPGRHQVDADGKCPDFICQSSNGDCENGGLCNEYAGSCECAFGFLGRDCTLPLGKNQGYNF